MKQVLLVEDNASFRKMVSTVLKSKGYEVTECPDGEECLIRIKEQEYKAVIMDLNMPGIDGMEMLKTLPQEMTNKKCKIIVVSGQSKDILKDLALKRGASDFIRKDEFDPDDLVKSIEAK